MKKIFYTKLLSALLLVAFITIPIGMFVHRNQVVPQAQAAGLKLGELGKGFVAGAAACVGVAYAMHYLASSITLMPSGPVPSSEGGTPIENALDCILYNVVNTIIEDMIKSITMWIQTGFKGNPVFVTQIHEHLIRQLDEIAGAYIEAKAPFLCSPFRAEIQLALAESYENQWGNPNACTLTKSISNIDEFMSGDFYAGGISGWVKMTTNPSNNKYGAFLDSYMGLQLKLYNKQQEESDDLLKGRGFLSVKVKDCYQYPADGMGPPAPYNEKKDGPATGQVVCNEPRTLTPGAFIQEQVGKELGRGAERLTFADEVNEMITALIAYLIKDVLLGEGGLAEYDPAKGTSEYPELPYIDEFPIFVGGGGVEACQAIESDFDATEKGDTIRFVKSGKFLTTSGINKHKDFYFGKNEEYRNKKYERVVVNLDVEVGELTSVPGSYNYHEIFYLTRGSKWWNQLIGHVGLKIDGRDGNKLVSEQHFAGVCEEGNQAEYTTFKGDKFHIEYIYDTVKKEVGVNLTSSSGGNSKWIFNVVDFIDSDNDGFKISIGGVQDDNGEYQVALGSGWVFSNLEVIITNDEYDGYSGEPPIGGDDDDGNPPGGGGGPPGGGLDPKHPTPGDPGTGKENPIYVPDP